MDTARKLTVLLASLLFSLFLIPSVPVRATTEFTFRGFKGNESEIRIAGEAAVIKPDGLLRLTNRASNVTGTAFYHKPVRLLETNRNATRVGSFSTRFVFVIIPSSSSSGGFGFTFTLSPTPNRPNAGSAQYLGVLNKENNGDPRNHVFAVEFDTVQGSGDDTDRIGNDIGLNFNNRTSDFQEPVVYYQNDDPNKREDFELESGNPIQALLNYDGATQTLNVTVYPAKLGFKPTKPLISRQIPKLLDVVQEEMYVGFTAATGKGDQSSDHYLMGWSFSSVGENPIAATLDLSELPPPPRNTASKRGFNSQIIVLIVALSAVMVIMLVLLFFFVMYKKRLRQEETLEDWEIDHPRRFRYRDLYVATDGFKEAGIIGTGGFGTVFKGKLANSEDLIAVKKIIPNSRQGVREFMAEIESLGRVRHRNLVNLQGWCKHRTDLLLIYDYIPNGSLDSLLYTVPRRSGAVLPWNARFEIAKGIASGLLYLHEEWEQIVVHRDVKPSNVLIESNMNPRLGDFGLARLYERGSLTETTGLVGTIGYVAPELARNGKPSSASDAFAFGVLLLEIVCGRKPTDSGSFFLVDWVMRLHARGEILSAIDPRLGSDYDGGEARVALAVGLLCCHQNPASRPSMRGVLRFLNGEEEVAEIDGEWGYSKSSRSDFGSKFVGYVPSSSSISSSSFVTRITSTSRVTSGESLCELACGLHAPSVPPAWERQLLIASASARVTHTHREYDDKVEPEAVVVGDFLVSRSFFFGPEEISAIRRLLPTDLHNTTFEAITSFLWRCRTVALSPDPNTEMRMTCIVNSRSKLSNPPIPSGYYGNVFAIPVAIATAKDLMEKPLEFPLRLIQEAKKSVTEDYIRSMTALMATRGRPMFVAAGNYIVSDLRHFDLGKVDFGPWGKPVYGGTAKAGIAVFPGVSFYVPFKNRKGVSGTVVAISLPVQAMEKFVEELDGVLHVT